MSTHVDQAGSLHPGRDLASEREELTDRAGRICHGARVQLDLEDRSEAIVREGDATSYLAVPVRAPGGPVMGRLVLRHDRTDAFDARDLALCESFATQAALLIALHARERSAAAAPQGREPFLRTLAHDLRNPLSALTTGTQALTLMGNLDDFSRRTVERMQRSALRMSRMITQLTDFARQHEGPGMALARQSCDLHALARDVIGEAEVAHPDRTIQLVTDGDGTGQLDVERVSAALATLVGNALVHGRPGSVVTVSISEDDAESIAVDVHSEGPPIPAEALPGIFDPYRRGAHTKSNGTEALGLGLYIVNAVAAAHGGQLDVSTSAEDGTTFRLVLPRRDAPSAD
jgi:signal transduction histidine kinase